MSKNKSIFINDTQYTGVLKNNEAVTRLLTTLKNSKKQYKVLTKKEEREMIDKYKDSDPVKMKQLLIMHNLRSVFALSKKYMMHCKDYSEMIQNGILGLSIAADKFDYTKNIKFITYATPWIFKYIVGDFYKKSNEIDNKSMSLDSIPKSNNDDENKTTLENILNKHIDPVAYKDDDITSHLNNTSCLTIYDKLRNDINNDTSLSALDKNVFISCFYEQNKNKQVAEKYNITAQTVIAIKNRVLKKLKNILKNNYNINSINDIIFC